MKPTYYSASVLIMVALGDTKSDCFAFEGVSLLQLPSE